MKHIQSASFRILVLSGLTFLLIGCIAEVDGGGYGRGGPWYHDGPWFDGPGWGAPRGGVGVEIHPPGFRR
jgi:hypothetical protein